MKRFLAYVIACVALGAVHVPAGEPHEALSIVNAQRRELGLPPFILDEGLTIAAEAAAKYRADRLMPAHTFNDFAFLPRGARADAAGCAGLDGNRWESCCWDDRRYRIAGAAWCRGRDGRRYTHIFVRY